MAKSHASFVCQNCGAVAQRWQGRCEACGAWNSIAEESAASGIGARATQGARKGRVFGLSNLHEADQAPPPRVTTGIGELDRVTGGGFVPGSVLLLGGEPGIGKSTLLIQACAAMAAKDRRVVYISGEEAVDQIRLRALRLGLAAAPVELAAETSVEDIVATLSHGKPPSLVVIDSIQTMWTELIESTPGTVSQVRGAAHALIRFAKTTGAAVILVGHVTKDGQIAGPRVVEHMVDAVISFEGEGGRNFLILRAVKNRFGPTDEIGVFEMTGRGLAEVANPSALFLSSRDAAAQVLPCLPEWKAHGRCSSRSRLLSRQVRLARRAGRSSVGIRRGSPWLSPSSKRMPASSSANMIFISMLPGVCVSASRPPI